MRLKSMISVMVMAALLLSLSVAYGWSDEYYGDVNPGPRGTISAPKVKAETLGRTTIKLTWKPVKGAKGYVIYKSKDLFNTDFKKVKTLYGGTKSSYKDTKCVKDSYYNYEIFAFQYRNGQKVYSQTCSLNGASGVIKPYLAVYPFSITEVSLYAKSLLADRIAIYHSQTPDGQFEKIGEHAIDEYNMIDDRVAFGETHYYRARAYKKINGKTYASPWSEVSEIKVYSPYLDIKVEDFNQPGQKTDTFIYKLTSDQYNFPATIYQSGKLEEEEIGYSYHGERKTAFSQWISEVPVVLDSYSTDGVTYIKFDGTYLLKAGECVYLKFKACDKVTYRADSRVSLDISYNQYRVNAGCISVSESGKNYFSYDY